MKTYEALSEFLIRSERSGNTELLVKAAKEDPTSFIITHDEQYARILRNRGVQATSIFSARGFPRNTKILVDHPVIQMALIDLQRDSDEKLARIDNHLSEVRGQAAAYLVEKTAVEKRHEEYVRITSARIKYLESPWYSKLNLWIKNKLLRLRS